MTSQMRQILVIFSILGVAIANGQSQKSKSKLYSFENAAVSSDSKVCSEIGT